MDKYKIGTQMSTQTVYCLSCAIRKADDMMHQGETVYVKDVYANKIVYGNYFRSTKL